MRPEPSAFSAMLSQVSLASKSNLQALIWAATLLIAAVSTTCMHCTQQRLKLEPFLRGSKLLLLFLEPYSTPFEQWCWLWHHCWRVLPSFSSSPLHAIFLEDCFAWLDRLVSCLRRSFITCCAWPPLPFVLSQFCVIYLFVQQHLQSSHRCASAFCF